MGNSKIYVTWEEIEDAVRSLARQIASEEFAVTAITAIPRGGLPAAVMLTHALKNYYDLDMEYIDLQEAITRGKHGVLIIDDVSDTGQALKDASTRFAAHDLATWTATLYVKQGTELSPDFYFQEVPRHWIVFPWEEF